MQLSTAEKLYGQIAATLDEGQKDAPFPHQLKGKPWTKEMRHAEAIVLKEALGNGDEGYRSDRNCPCAGRLTRECQAWRVFVKTRLSDDTERWPDFSYMHRTDAPTS
ncbi:MAG: hypothetical protein ACE5NG_03435 [bacterium]